MERKKKVNAERERQRYSKEFKLAAVKLLQPGQARHPNCDGAGHTTQPALQMGRRHSSGKAGIQKPSFRGPQLAEHHDPLKAEVNRLKRELASVTEERDILKKAEAYFAKSAQVKYAFIQQHRAV